MRSETQSTAESSHDQWRLLLDNYPRFRSFVSGRVGNRADADEILQSAFIRVVDKLHEVQNETVVAWFFRVLRNAVIDHRRHHEAERRALDRQARMVVTALEATPPMEQAICRCVLRVISGLKPDVAWLLRRIDLEGTSIAEVAAEMHTTANNLRVRLHRTRVRLREKLEETCGACAEHGRCLDCGCGHSQPA